MPHWWKRRGTANSIEDRSRALARLVARRGFDPRGLTLVEVDGGFLVRGLRVEGRGGPVVISETIAAEELLAEVEELRS